VRRNLCGALPHSHLPMPVVLEAGARPAPAANLRCPGSRGGAGGTGAGGARRADEQIHGLCPMPMPPLFRFVGFVYREVRMHCRNGRPQSIEILLDPHGGYAGAVRNADSRRRATTGCQSGAGPLCRGGLA
jgi:hypothetical protein